MTTPDPLDALKYAFVLTLNQTDQYEDLDPMLDALRALVAPWFATGIDVDLRHLRYSDGRPVMVSTHVDLPIRGPMDHIQLPPGYPTGHHAA